MEEGIKRKREESLAEGNYDLKNRNITEPPSKKAKQVKSNYFLRSSLSPSVHKSNGSAERLSKVEATSSELAESESTVFVQNEI
ncbi:MAG TPA: hypothetical protein DCE71_06915, partial [Parachlamydiales bacterium]|nr:hypothetical protein [Parachlamydiales bacterium]